MDSGGLHIASLYEYERNISVSTVDIQDTAISLPTGYNSASESFLPHCYPLVYNYQQYFYCPSHQTPQSTKNNKIFNVEYCTCYLGVCVCSCVL
jgi:hypothetical protein